MYNPANKYDSILTFMSRINFMLIGGEFEKSFIISEPGRFYSVMDLYTSISALYTSHAIFFFNCELEPVPNRRKILRTG